MHVPSLAYARPLLSIDGTDVDTPCTIRRARIYVPWGIQSSTTRTLTLRPTTERSLRHFNFPRSHRNHRRARIPAQSPHHRSVIRSFSSLSHTNMITGRIYSEQETQDSGFCEDRSMYSNPDYHDCPGLEGEDDRLLRRSPSPASSTSSISNPALLAIELPLLSTRDTSTVWEAVQVLLRIVHATGWVCGGAATLGLVGHSVGWVVLHSVSTNSDTNLNTDVVCVVGPGVIGTVALSVPSVVAYLGILRARAQTRTPGSLFALESESGGARTNRKAGRYCLLGVVLVVYGAGSGALGWAIVISRQCTISAQFAVSVGAAGCFFLALACAACDSLLCEMSALEVARTEDEESLSF